MMGPFLVIIGLVLFYAASKDKSGDLLNALFFDDLAQKVNTAEQSVAQDLGAWMQFHIWNQLANAVISAWPKVSIPTPLGTITIGAPNKLPTNANDAAQGRHP